MNKRAFEMPPSLSPLRDEISLEGGQCEGRIDIGLDVFSRLRLVNADGTDLDVKLIADNVTCGGEHHEQAWIGRLEKIGRISQFHACFHLQDNGFRELLQSFLFVRAIAQEVEFKAMRNPIVAVLVKQYPKWNTQIFHLMQSILHLPALGEKSTSGFVGIP
ncbi:MAG TPA: hypothetical protein VFC46_10880 [Humisphaera sp.]|nr:hypothetical protein [Humisphaera sp.]